MGKTIIVFEDGKVIDTIEEDKWEGVRVENGRLVANASSASEPEAGAQTVPASEPEAVTYTAPAAPEAPAASVAPTPPAAEPERPEAEPEKARAYAAPAEEAQAAAFTSGPRPAPAWSPAAEQRGETARPSASSAPYAAAAAAAAAQYPWRGEAAYEHIGQKAAGRGGVDAKKVIAVILGLLLAASAGFGGGIAAVNTGNFYYPAANPQITISPTDQVSTTEAVAAKVIPSVVGITSIGTRTTEVFPFGAYDERTGGVGTGIIVDKSGYILTNSHVVLDGEVDTITVLLPDGRDVQGDVLWNERTLDLAIVKVNADNLIAAELGDSDKMNIGAYVAAIGNPMGLNFRSSVSQGVVSGLDRTIIASSGTGQSAVPMEGLIQVDAAINVGNSGGPLVNSLGQVIGINTARNQDGEGMGFAIPINTAKPIVDSVKEKGEFHRVYIGVQAMDVADVLRSDPQLDLGTDSGAYVSALTPGSPAEAAGIQEKDVIVEVDGKQINTSSELIKSLLRYRSGDVAEIEIIRDKRSLRFEVTLTDSLE
ncbi:MAG: trypsin-like peptidase domain-containing protein [Clostridiales Family XIII bacterium]|jgi:S1-C subfamily serine protease|nr:trypsin-like peptidase domain-containing protein [Clostridiales Family XIII bacterium]